VAEDTGEDRGAAGPRGGLTETRVVLQPLASPLALGFLGLAGATFTLAGLNLGWVDTEESQNVALIVFAFTVPLQFLASLIGFRARDGVAATGMGLLSGIWFAQAVVLVFAEPGSTSDALGLFLLLGGLAMLVPASAATAGKLVAALVLGTAALRFFTTGLYQLTDSDAWKTTAGVVGVILAVFAVYAPWAAELEDVWKRPVLPFGRRGAGRDAVARGLAAAEPDLLREPGVRGQL
jgi:succinate-acetate transporter protein